MEDASRTTRFVALMIGNGFAFVQYFNIVMDDVSKGKGGDFDLLCLSLVSFLGIAAAYGALHLSARDKWSSRVEWISIIALASSLGCYAGYVMSAADEAGKHS
jgi:hypothetical protein